MKDDEELPDRQTLARVDEIRQALREAVAEELDRKRRLGHYAVFWENGRVVLRGEDAPVIEGCLTERGWARVAGMSPTVARVGPFRLFFFSREEPRMHVHVAHPDGEAKFWLTPAVELATAAGLSKHELSEAQAIVEKHYEEIVHAWHQHFGG